MEPQQVRAQQKIGLLATFRVRVRMKPHDRSAPRRCTEQQAQQAMEDDLVSAGSHRSDCFDSDEDSKTGLRVRDRWDVYYKAAVEMCQFRGPGITSSDRKPRTADRPLKSRSITHQFNAEAAGPPDPRGAYNAASMSERQLSTREFISIVQVKFVTSPKNALLVERFAGPSKFEGARDRNRTCTGCPTGS